MKTRMMIDISHATDDVAQVTDTSPTCAVLYSPSEVTHTRVLDSMMAQHAEVMRAS